jgi:hypothetical protein
MLVAESIDTSISIRSRVLFSELVACTRKDFRDAEAASAGNWYPPARINDATKTINLLERCVVILLKFPIRGIYFKNAGSSS